jgi:hypothetical protein
MYVDKLRLKGTNIGGIVSISSGNQVVHLVDHSSKSNALLFLVFMPQV